MTIVDSHAHIGRQRFEPVEALLFQMERHHVAHAVLVHYWPKHEQPYVFESLRKHPGKFAAAVVTERDDDGTELRALHEQGAVGVRLLPTQRSKGSDPLAIWRTAAELNLVVSLAGVPSWLLSEQFNEVLRACPNLTMVIEHLGFHGTGDMNVKKTEPSLDIYRRVLALARYENLSIKLPGFGEFCGVPPLSLNDVPPYADLALEAFGTKRMMWGSDFPPVSAREGYAASLEVPRNYFATLSEDEQADLFGRTAAAIWRL